MALQKVTLYDTAGVTAAIFELDAAGVTAFKTAFKGPNFEYTTEIPIPTSLGTKKERTYNLANFGSYDVVTP